MPQSQNGYPVLESGETKLWEIPGTERTLRLAQGSVGFVLVHFATWFDQEIELLDREKTWDDWGYAVRDIRGSDTISNHASGTAMDLNAVRHPMGVAANKTFTQKQIAAIHRRLRWFSNCIRWGGDYNGRPDPMHFEINRGRDAVRRLAHRLEETKLGDSVKRRN